MIDCFIVFGLADADTYKKNQKRKEQREKLGLAPVPKSGSGSKTPVSEPTDVIQKVEVSVFCV